MMARIVPTLVCAVALLAASAAAWGPTSHYYFTCTAAGVPLDECLTHSDLLSGTEMPDAFGFASLLSPLGPASLPCQAWQYLDLHSPLLAGYLFQEAPKFMSPTFNATAFAIGFGMHVTADAAGFYDHGYLGYGWGSRYTPIVNDTANWMGLWPFMAAVDAHVYKTYFEHAHANKLPRAGVPSTSVETANFVVATVQAAIANGSTFSGINSTTLQSCAAMWQSLLSDESVKVEVTPVEAYGFELVYNDRFGAKNHSEAFAHFDKVRGCAVNAAKVWHKAISTGSVTPMAAVEATIGYIEGAYANGDCTPVAMKAIDTNIQW